MAEPVMLINGLFQGGFPREFAFTKILRHAAYFNAQLERLGFGSFGFPLDGEVERGDVCGMKPQERLIGVALIKAGDVELRPFLSSNWGSTLRTCPSVAAAAEPRVKLQRSKISNQRMGKRYPAREQTQY